MAKIKIIFDTKTSDVEIFIGKKKVEDIYGAFLHQDVENSYKFSLQLFSDQDGILKFRNGKVEKEFQDTLFLNKIVNYFGLGDKK